MHHCLAVSSEFYTEIPDTLDVCLTYVDILSFQKCHLISSILHLRVKKSFNNNSEVLCVQN